MNFIDRDFALHERALRLRGQRMETLSANIANADTPNFKARDIDFRQAISAAMGQVRNAEQMTITRAGHQPFEGGVTATQAALKYRVPFNTAFDGNTVELTMEQAKFGRASGEFQASLTFLENRASSIRKALKGE